MDEGDLAELYLSWKQEVLKELRPYIVKNLQPEKLFVYLRSCEVLDEDDEEEIRAKTTRKRKNEFLIDLIGQRGSDGFDNFCEAVRQNTTQLFILKTILDCFHKKKENYNENSIQAEQSRQQNQRLHLIDLPTPGQPGGPVIPHFERSRSPPPPYSETCPYP